jgi:shikimate dehydrogenase
VQPNKTLKGYNTDYLGFMAGLSDLPAPTNTDKVLLLGAGGGARAVVVALDVLGYKNLIICNRDSDKAENLAQIWPHAIEIAAWDSRHQYLAQAQLIINSTSLGMVGQPPLELYWPSHLQPNAVAYDLVYQPLATEFLLMAQKLGAQTIDGLTMLIAQAAPAFEKFFGQTPTKDFKVLRQIILDFLVQKPQESK